MLGEPLANFLQAGFLAAGTRVEYENFHWVLVQSAFVAGHRLAPRRCRFARQSNVLTMECDATRVRLPTPILRSRLLGLYPISASCFAGLCV